MATATQIFKALIQADSSGAVTELRKFDGAVDSTVAGTMSRTDKLKGAFAGWGKAAAIAGGAAAVAIGKDSVRAAVDLEESINAVRVTYKGAADQVLVLGENAVETAGLAKSEFNQLAVQFAAFAQQIAGPGGDVVGVLNDLTIRAADFASVMNLDVNDAARIFMSTLAGESEPIRKFGHNISAAAVEQFALARGLVESKSELDDTTKLMARYGLLMEATADAQGDFANTSGSLANQTRKLSADFENLKADIGEGLTPVIAELVVMLRSLGTVAESLHLDDVFREAFMEWDSFGLSVGRNIRSFGEWAGVVEGSADGNRRLVASFEAAEAAVQGFDRSLLDGVTSGDEARRVAEEYAATVGGVADATHVANSIFVEWSNTQKLAADEAKKLAIAEALARDEIVANERAVTFLSAATKAKADRDAEAAEASAAHEAAIKKLFDQVDKRLGTIHDYEEATLDLENSVHDLAEQYAATIKVQNDAKASDGAKAQATRDLRSSQIAAAESALKAAEAYADEAGAARNTTNHYVLQREALQRMRDQYPGLRGEIDGYIAILNRIPEVKSTRIITEYTYRGQRAPSMTKSDQFSVGGTVRGARGTPVPIIAHAGEQIIPTHAVNRLPSMGMAPVINVDARGSTTESVQLIPEKVAEALAVYERRHGPRYQRAA